MMFIRLKDKLKICIFNIDILKFACIKLTHTANVYFLHSAALAQLVEQLICNQ